MITHPNFKTVVQTNHVCLRRFVLFNFIGNIEKRGNSQKLQIKNLRLN